MTNQCVICCGDMHIDEPLWLDLADRIDGELAGREAQI